MKISDCPSGRSPSTTLAVMYYKRMFLFGVLLGWLLVSTEAFFGTGSSSVIAKLEALCKPDKIPTAKELTALETISKNYFNHIEKSLLDYWKCDCIAQGLGTVKGYYARRDIHDLSLITQVAYRCSNHAITDSGIFKELLMNVQTLRYEYREVFAYTALFISIEEILKVKRGNSKDFRWTSIASIPYPNSTHDFKRYEAELSQRYPNLATFEAVCITAQHYTDLDSPRALEKLLQTKGEELRELSDYPRVVGGYLVEIDETIEKINLERDREGDLTITFCLEALKRLKRIIMHVLKVLLKVKGIPEQTLNQISLKRVGKTVVIVDKTGMDLDDPAYRATQIVLFHLSSMRFFIKPQGPEAFSKAIAQIKILNGEAQRVIQQVKDHMAQQTENASLIDQDLQVLGIIAAKIFLAINNDQSNETVTLPVTVMEPLQSLLSNLDTFTKETYTTMALPPSHDIKNDPSSGSVEPPSYSSDMDPNDPQDQWDLSITESQSCETLEETISQSSDLTTRDEEPLDPSNSPYIANQEPSSSIKRHLILPIGLLLPCVGGIAILSRLYWHRITKLPMMEEL